MTSAILIEKLKLEIEISPIGLGDIRIYSFIYEESKRNDELTKNTMIKIGYDKTEIANIKSKYTNKHKKASMNMMLF